jgi:hypothetical protein
MPSASPQMSYPTLRPEAWRVPLDLKYSPKSINKRGYKITGEAFGTYTPVSLSTVNRQNSEMSHKLAKKIKSQTSLNYCKSRQHTDKTKREGGKEKLSFEQTKIELKCFGEQLKEN